MKEIEEVYKKVFISKGSLGVRKQERDRQHKDGETFSDNMAVKIPSNMVNIFLLRILVSLKFRTNLKK